MDPREESRRALEALRQHVHASPLSQRGIEARGGFSRGHLSQLLAGHLELKMSHLLAILGALGVAPGRFFGSIYPDPRRKALAALRERSRQGAVGVPRDMDALYDFGFESLSTLRERLERCERAIDHLERLGLLTAADLEPSLEGDSCRRGRRR